MSDNIYYDTVEELGALQMGEQFVVPRVNVKKTSLSATPLFCQEFLLSLEFLNSGALVAVLLSDRQGKRFLAGPSCRLDLWFVRLRRSSLKDRAHLGGVFYEVVKQEDLVSKAILEYSQNLLSL